MIGPENVTDEELRNDSDYVMYLGFPMRLYQVSYMPVLWGFWSWIPVVFAVEPMLGGDGWGFIQYKKGTYLKTLFNYLFGDKKGLL